MRRDAARILPFVAVLLCGGPAWAQPDAEQVAAREASESSGRSAGPSLIDGGGFGELSFTSSDEPLVIEADQLEFDYDENRLVYRGSVRVVQGDFELESKALTITFTRAEELENAELQRVVAQGDVEIKQGERRASGQRAVFDQNSRQLILRGNPVLRDGLNEVQGERMTVFLDEGRSVVESGEKKRVSAVLYPGKPDGAGAGAGKESPPPNGASNVSPKASAAVDRTTQAPAGAGVSAEDASLPSQAPGRVPGMEGESP